MSSLDTHTLSSGPLLVLIHAGTTANAGCYDSKQILGGENAGNGYLT